MSCCAGESFIEKIDFDRLTVTYNNLLVEQEKIQRLLELGNYLLSTPP
jgi:hypothetical protein